MTSFVQIVCTGCNQTYKRQVSNVKRVKDNNNGVYQCRDCFCSQLKNWKGTPLHNSYAASKNRCQNPNSQSYRNYGGRGIRFLWTSFDDFLRDMSNGHFDSASLDRIDVNGNYCKENCRWATAKEQARNTRKNIHTEQQVEEIRKMYAAGVKQIELAKIFCDSQGNISNIITNKSWATV
jgi:hypothetical protein